MSQGQFLFIAGLQLLTLSAATTPPDGKFCYIAGVVAMTAGAILLSSKCFK